MRGEVRNESGQLTFTVAANGPVLQHLNSRSLLYVRDDDGNIISVCRPIIDEGSNG